MVDTSRYSPRRTSTHIYACLGAHSCRLRAMWHYNFRWKLFCVRLVATLWEKLHLPLHNKAILRNITFVKNNFGEERNRAIFEGPLSSLVIVASVTYADLIRDRRSFTDWVRRNLLAVWYRVRLFTPSGVFSCIKISKPHRQRSAVVQYLFLVVTTNDLFFFSVTALTFDNKSP